MPRRVPKVVCVSPRQLQREREYREKSMKQMRKRTGIVEAAAVVVDPVVELRRKWLG